MAATQRSQIEDAVASAVAALSYMDASRSRVWNGPLDPSPDDLDFKRAVQSSTPIVLVTTGPGEYRDHAMHNSKVKASVHFNVELLVISGILSTAEYRNRGDDNQTKDLGIYKMIEDIRGALYGVEMNVDGVGFLKPASEIAVIRSPDRHVWRLTYEVGADVDIDLEANDDTYATMRNEINNADDDAADPVITADRSLS